MEEICEQWKPVVGYEGYYEISDTGKVRSLKRLVKFKDRKITIHPRDISIRTDCCGYKTVRLSKNGESRTRFVHSLIARAFIPNPLNKPVVNHINGIKTDNSISNLEWVTHSENMKHAYKLGLCSAASRETPVIDMCSGKTFTSIKKAAEHLGISYETCKGYLRNRRSNKTCLQYMEREVA